MGGMSSLPYSPPTRAKGMWKALSRLKEFSLTATPLRSPSTSKFQENPDVDDGYDYDYYYDYGMIINIIQR